MRDLDAIFPGSFDPVTYGHIDILKRGLEIFDKIVIAVLFNPSKKTLLSAEERVELLYMETSVLDSVKQDAIKIIKYHGLLAEFAKMQNIKYILRGIRSEVDFTYELPMAQMNKELNKDLETVFIVTDPALGYMSSGLIRDITSFDYSDDISLKKWISPAAEQMLKNKYKK